MSIQVLRGVPATVGVTLVDQDGSPRDAGGAVTASVAYSNGTVSRTGVDTTPGAGQGQVEVTLTRDELRALDVLMVTFSEDGGGDFEVIVEIIGGYIFSLGEARALNMFADVDKYPDAVLLAARRAVMEECLAITGRSVVPRFKRVSLNGRYAGHIRLPDYDVRAVRDMTIDGVIQSDDVLDELRVEPWGTVAFKKPGVFFPWGEGIVSVGYEYGLNGPPQRVHDAALVRLQSLASMVKRGAPDRFDFQIVDGKLYSADAPGVRGSMTGIREVDSAYAAFGVSGTSTELTVI